MTPGMDFPFLNRVQDLWEMWEIRTCILCSLFLQCFLLLVSPLRKRCANSWIYISIWSAYLLADWVANFVVGQISSNQGDKPCNDKNGNADLLAFWAPFLLVHLGGPDTITAFALEDNELWRRHLLTLIFQSVSAAYVLFQSLPQNQLLIPTLCMFVSGVIKYGERTRALLLASVDDFRDRTVGDPEPGPNYAKLMDKYHSMKEANLPTSIKTFTKQTEIKTVNKVKEGELSDTEVVLYAHCFFETFKGIIVDILFSYRERNQYREFFLRRLPEDAFKVIEVELSFIYDVFFTKVSVVYNGWGYFFRFISSSMAITSLGIFYFEDKSNFEHADIAITYTLLIGAIALDVIAFIMLITSDWRKLSIRKLPAVNIEVTEGSSKTPGFAFFEKLVHLLPKPALFKKLVQLWRRRWSESVSSFNLIDYAQHSHRHKVMETIISYLGLTNFIERLLYVKSEPFSKKLRNHIFSKLKERSEMAEDLTMAKELSAAKGDWTLRIERHDELLPYILDKDYDQSLLLWHIATELCYWEKSDDQGNFEDANDAREIAKSLSDYMLYLLIMQPSMMSTIAGLGQIRFKDTCAESSKFFTMNQEGKGQKEIFKFLALGKVKWISYVYAIFKFLAWGVITLLSPLLATIAALFITLISILASLYIVLFLPLISTIAYAAKADWHEQVENHYIHVVDYFSKKEQNKKRKHRKDCLKILQVHTDVEPVRVKGDKSKSVLFDGCILAKELKELPEERKWDIISQVWVEMLSYAAINCRADQHTQQLSRGGELLTVVWMLMIQLGLGSQFQISEGHERAKLKVGK